MNLDKTLIIVIFTLFLTLGCESPVNSSNPKIASSSANVQIKKSSNHSQVSDTTTQECIMDDSKSINISYPPSLNELKINGYSTFTLESVDEIEENKGRPHEFTRIYKNDQGYTATLMSQNAIRNLELIDAKGQSTSYSFNSGLECDALPSTNYSTYIVSADKAFIYRQPYLDSKTSSYFIAGDEIKVLSIKDDWIQTSYLKGSKTGWLRLNNLEEKNHSNSPPKELTSIKIKDASEGIQLIKSDQKKYVLNKDGISNISLGQKFKANEFIKFESQLEGVDNCFLANSNLYPDHQYSLSFQFFDDMLTGVGVSKSGTTNFDSFTSYTGVKIGDTVETVMKLHNKQPDETFDSPHTDDPIFIYWTDNSKKTGIRYNISTGKVLSMSLNFEPHIRYFEGCG
ncbi:SH3 domain-containing protein [Psychrobacter fozii]|uniref:hypothetical protein n=1 Tax=Psychrobacter fozii TaxID=198480 RepID=UPI00191AC812|nr:hypothetical protein [Psychrobacter fozii]